MLDHEEADEQARRGRRQQQSDPMTADNSRPEQSPDDKQGYGCNHQLENAARAVGLAIAGEQLSQGAGFWWALNHISTAFEQLRLGRQVHQPNPWATAPRPRGSCINWTGERVKARRP